MPRKKLTPQQKAAQTNLKKDPDFYKKLSAKALKARAGKSYKTGFQLMDKATRKAIAAKGGRASKRKPFNSVNIDGYDVPYMDIETNEPAL